MGQGNGINEAAGKMTRLCRKIVHANLKLNILDRVAVFRRLFRFIWDRLLVCSRPTSPRAAQYRRLNRPDSLEPAEDGELADLVSGYETDSDLVSLKISLLGDCQIGKTSFVVILLFLKK